MTSSGSCSSTTFHSEAYPNLGDLAYLSGYVSIAAGMLKLLHRQQAWSNLGALVDGLIVAVAAGVLLWVFFIGPAAADAQRRQLGTDRHDGLPGRRSADDRARCPGRHAGALVDRCGRDGRRHAPLLAGDLWYARLAQQGTYSSGHPVDALWWLSYALIAAALVHPRLGEVAMVRESDEHSLSLRRLAVLAATTMTAPVTIAARSAADVDVELVPLLTGTIVLFLLVVVRLAVVAQQLESSRSQLEHDATHDPLTGLGNRALYSERVRRAIEATATTPDRTAVLCIDIDDFKTVNDSLGHSAGDRMLQEVGNAVALGGATGRLGGTSRR